MRVQELAGKFETALGARVRSQKAKGFQLTSEVAVVLMECSEVVCKWDEAPIAPL
jgi:hypothetical protein